MCVSDKYGIFLLRHMLSLYTLMFATHAHTRGYIQAHTFSDIPLVKRIYFSFFFLRARPVFFYIFYSLCRGRKLKTTPLVLCFKAGV